LHFSANRSVVPVREIRSSTDTIVPLCPSAARFGAPAPQSPASKRLVPVCHSKPPIRSRLRLAQDSATSPKGGTDQMIETISLWWSVRLRHEPAPLLKKREHYLTHLLQRGYGRESARCTAAYLVHVVRVMNMNSMRIVPQREIETAGQSWAAHEGPLRKKLSFRGSPRVFVPVAQKWLRFHGQLATPLPNRFRWLITEFSDTMRSARGLAPTRCAVTAPLHLGF